MHQPLPHFSSGQLCSSIRCTGAVRVHAPEMKGELPVFVTLRDPPSARLAVTERVRKWRGIRDRDGLLELTDA